MTQRTCFPFIALAAVLAVVVVSGASCFVPTRNGFRVITPPHPHVYVPTPVVIAPRRVYVAPPPVYVAPPPVYVAPPPAVVYAPAPGPPPSADYAPPPPQGGPNVTCVDPAERDIPERFDQAMPVAATSETVACSYRGDVDTFYVTAPPANGGQIIQYSLRGYSQMAPIIEILDGNRASLGRYTGNPSGELRGWVHVAGGTPIYIRVSQIYGVNEPYMLALASGPLVDASEPNGDLEHATPLADGGSVQAFLSNAANDPTSLLDWYRIDIARDRNLTLDVDMSEGIAPHVELFNANRREITRQSGGPGERIQLVARVPRGTYYVKLGSTYGVPRTGQGALPPWLVRPYTLSAR